MSYVVAIDVGIKNLAICAYDFVSCQVVHWDNVTLIRMVTTRSGAKIKYKTPKKKTPKSASTVRSRSLLFI